MERSQWRPVEVRWLEGSRRKQTPIEIFLQGAWRSVELLAEELRQGPDPGDSIRRRYFLRIDEAIYFLEGPFEQDAWKLCVQGQAP
jgi:hypothetical protein